MRGRGAIYAAVLVGAPGLIYAAAQADAVHHPPNQTIVAAKDGGSQDAGLYGSGQREMLGVPLGALNRPLVRMLFGAFLIPELQAELGLTPDQVTQLKQLKVQLMAQGDDFSARIAAKEKDLDALFAPDTSKGQQVKLLLEQISELRAQENYTIYATARKMKGVLTDEQRNRLEAMKPEELRHAAMAHLTLEEFAQATQLLRLAL